MKNRINSFFAVLDLELKDLEKDLELLVDQYTRRHDDNKISNYVFLENCALLQNEIFGIEGFAKDVKKMDPGTYHDVESVMNTLRQLLYARFENGRISKPVLQWIERKLEKVNAYVQTIALS